IDRATSDLADGLRDADFVLLATPVRAIEELLAQAWDAIPANAIVTDVGSSKAAIVRTADSLARGRRLAFVGSHPMAGSEKSGYGVSRARLFENALFVVTPTRACEPGAVQTVTACWARLGARVTTRQPGAHGLAVAPVRPQP